MCRYQDWEDDLPDSEVHDEYPGREAVTAFIRQIELQMNEIRGFLDNMKADSSKKPNKFWSGFLSGVCFTILLNYVINSIHVVKKETPVVVDVLTCTIYLAALWHLSPL
ncbi:hypothetical protein Pyn_06641 [Prunus yedoensis var. nudiflora]|uniref:Uncharacterized protein n=1 Tax=Prunus yedoensis var. nudiflora TaxID=2094558 RepID=A0A314UU38_PRUYE|nr:hypothetical protein Pyn_06641 [Prunus yedoensis var. nudiflora]